jgi:hypothetical protein
LAYRPFKELQTNLQKHSIYFVLIAGDTFTAAVKCADVSQYNIETPSNDIRLLYPHAHIEIIHFNDLSFQYQKLSVF